RTTPPRRSCASPSASARGGARSAMAERQQVKRGERKLVKARSLSLECSESIRISQYVHGGADDRQLRPPLALQQIVMQQIDALLCLWGSVHGRHSGGRELLFRPLKRNRWP